MCSNLDVGTSAIFRLPYPMASFSEHSVNPYNPTDPQIPTACQEEEFRPLQTNQRCEEEESLLMGNV